MAYDVHYLDTQTGDRRIDRFNLAWDGDSSISWHAHGNMACDCNRSRMFEVDDDDAECNLGANRYVIEKIVGDGVVIDDFELLNPDNPPLVEKSE